MECSLRSTVIYIDINNQALSWSLVRWSQRCMESVKRLDMVWQSKTPISKLLRFEIRQWPAVQVVPVFTPYHPFYNNLFVFFHIFLVVRPQRSFLMSSYISLVVTIFRKRSSLSAKAERAMMACAVEKLGLEGSPELLFHSWLSQSSLEKEFICPMKVQKQLLFCYFFLWRWITFPISSAKHIEASLPLGNINPYNKSSTFNRSPAVNQAEVPGVSGILSGTRQKQFLRSISYFLQMRMERQQVMILLKEAISISLVQLKAATGQFCYTSQTQYILALSTFTLFYNLIAGCLAMPSLILAQCYTPFCKYARNPFLNRFSMLDFSQNLYTDRAWFNLEGEQFYGFLWLGDSQAASTLSSSCEGLRLLLILGMLILALCCVFSSGLSLEDGQLILVLAMVSSSVFLFLRILLSYPHLKSIKSITALFSGLFLGCSLPPL